MSTEKNVANIIVEEISAKQGKIGKLTLNAPDTLNSLTLDMVTELFKHLEAWEQDPNIALVILQGSGEKAFCAGGDVQQLYRSATETPGGPCSYAEDFFRNEYRLNYKIHCYSKPLLCIGHGIVMGGGLGLMAGASHRVATPSTRIAMPEITIGLFPDVGGTWFLSRMPRGLGLFFALTGAPLNAHDALYCKLVDAVMSQDDADNLEARLCEQSWRKESQANSALLSELIESKALDSKMLNRDIHSEIKACLSTLEQICQQTSLGEVLFALHNAQSDSSWLKKAANTQAHGSPLSALLIYEQLRRYHYASLKEVFLSEYRLATNIVRYPEFAEGVRALLIDKDKDPKWRYQHFSQVPASELEDFFSPPWPENPLLDLLEQDDEVAAA